MRLGIEEVADGSTRACAGKGGAASGRAGISPLPEPRACPIAVSYERSLRRVKNPATTWVKASLRSPATI